MKSLNHFNSPVSGAVPIIDDDTPTDFLFDPQFARGHDPSQVVPGMHATPDSMVLIDPSNYDALIDEQEREESSLEHIYLRAGWENLDQNGDGYCWSYSVGHTQMICRSRDNQPYVRLNPHGPAAIIKGGRDEGGWCGLSAKFAVDVGYPSEAVWKPQSRDTRQDTPEMRANCGLHKVSEGFYDLQKAAYDQELSLKQLYTQLLRNNPCAVDMNWWGHSICAVRLVRVESGSYGILILNSWKGWGRRGLAVLRGGKGIPDGALCVSSTTASIK